VSILNIFDIVLLIGSGVLVGFINTLAGGGTIISLSVFMLLGLPPVMANGTHRIAATFQTLTSSVTFFRKRVLDVRQGLVLSIPVVAGSMLGAFVAVEINEALFKRVVAVVMLGMLFFILFKPQLWLQGRETDATTKIRWWHHLLFFLIGIYGGFIHVGVGYFLIIAAVLGLGLDLVRSNAMKVFVVFIYTPLTLMVFGWKGQVDWGFGLVHAIGNVVGAWLAARYAVEWGAGFVRWVIVIVILLSSGQLLGVFDLAPLFRALPL